MLIAGGGTGGHLFPGLALAEELLLRKQGHQVLFVGTRRGIEFRQVPRAGFDLELIEVGGLKGKGLWGWIRGLLRLPRALWQSLRILRRFAPDVVVGVGGYASGPVLLSAALKRMPTVVLEQNALPGMTNRLLGKLVRRVLIAFPQAQPFFPARKVSLLGNPVRQALAENILQHRQELTGLRVLVFGGSQGAQTLNQVVPEAMALVQEQVTDLELMHQTGEAQREAVTRRYQELSLSAQVLAFIDDMAQAYRQADLVICRAGATTVAELALCRRASLLIPYPLAADNHQEINAQALVQAGAAVMIREADLSAEKLAAEVVAILGDRERREKMESAAASVGRPEAARDICEVCLEMTGLDHGPRRDGV